MKEKRGEEERGRRKEGKEGERGKEERRRRKEEG